MKKIKVTEKNGLTVEYQNNGEVIDRLHLMGHGLSERIVDDVEGSYDPADVVEHIETVIEEATEETPAVIKNQVKLKAEYTIEVIDITAQVEQEKTNAEALEYLASTDWMIIREIDSGLSCPAEIKAERAAARARIVR